MLRMRMAWRICSRKEVVTMAGLLSQEIESGAHYRRPQPGSLHQGIEVAQRAA